MPDNDKTWEEQRYADDKARKLSVIREREKQEKLEAAYIAVAATEEGRVVLADIVNSSYTEMPFEAFKGNSQDAYNIGRGAFAVKTKRYLRAILDRETFISIIEPEKEEE